MAISFKLTQPQYNLIKNDAIHYNLSMRFNSKENMWEGEAESMAQMKVIKKLVDN